MVNIRLQRYGIFLNNQTILGLFSKLNWLFLLIIEIFSLDQGVGSSDHFQESVILIMIHYCLNSHIICPKIGGHCAILGLAVWRRQWRMPR